MALSRELDLFQAAKTNELEKIEQLLQQKTSFQTRFNSKNIVDNDFGFDAFYMAAKKGHVSLVKKFLSLGADPNKAYDNGTYILHSAVFAGHTKIVQLLINHNADVNQKDRLNRIPSDYAYHQSVIDQLKKAGAISRDTYFQKQFIRNANELISELKINIPSIILHPLNKTGVCHGLTMTVIEYSQLGKKDICKFYIRFVNHLTDQSVKELARQYANNKDYEITDGHFTVSLESLINFIRKVEDRQSNQLKGTLLKYGMEYDACHLIACERSDLAKNISFNALKKGNPGDNQYKLINYNYKKSHHIMMLQLQNKNAVFYNSNAVEGEQNCQDENEFAKMMNLAVPIVASAVNHMTFFIYDISFAGENIEFDNLLQTYNDQIQSEHNLLSFVLFYRRGLVSKRDAAFNLYQIIKEFHPPKLELNEFKNKLQEYLVTHPLHLVFPDLNNQMSNIKEYYSHSLWSRLCGRGSVEITNELLINGANINAKYKSERTATFYAYLSGQVEMFKFLLWSSQAELGPSDARKENQNKFIANRQREIELLIKQKQNVDQLIIDSDMSKETKPAVKIQKLFYSYAHPPFFSTYWRNNRQLAHEISEELVGNSDWSIDQCLSYIHAQIKDQQIDDMGTFAGIFLVIDQMKKESLSLSVSMKCFC